MTSYPHRVTGPEHLPELRRWLVREFRPGGHMARLFSSYGVHDAPWVHRTLTAAQLWWIDADASRVLHESSPDVPADTTLDMGDLPTMAGFAAFATPFFGRPVDPNGPTSMRAAFAATGTTPEERRIRVDAIAWGPVLLPPLHGAPRTALGIASFKCYDAGSGMDAQDLAEFTSYVSHERDFMDALRLGAAVTENPEGGLTIAIDGALYGFLGRTDWQQGDTVDTTIEDAPRQTPEALASMAEDRRLVAALWSMARTKFVHMEPAPRLPKPERRRNERAGLDHAVRVMSLGGIRRVYDDAENQPADTDRQWKHSWIVSPHWRWQPYGPGRSQRRLTLIAAYRKGPEGAPLLGADRVFALRQRPATTTTPKGTQS